MITRRMNTRITIFSRIAGQNEDGEVVDSIRNDVYQCWAEVVKTGVKDFKVGGKSYVGDLAQNGQKPLESYKDEKVFIIRYHPKPPFDNSMYVDFNGFEYKITELEIDYASKEMIMIKAVRIS
ncbi:phage head completion protein [Streptococcus suis]|uniref:phage head completion protein n=1 Tax=Streptococcus suis TaxID=1307 RepID=UPI000C199A59|nr:head-tail adaptor protein [Streptococcus suis]NQK33649.1 head-tail adaptor protein [Streptococcus suis]NQM00652.1 head-tail adaptor protein [Streptococcus suis]NQN65658.1 head-tail adaptor protein [Streptococcus suis]NQN82740.1 head-tail adaptor protein [Streptococcus suis]NRG54216.1 head-tail adaptor protein [Streptococcus suis]